MARPRLGSAYCRFHHSKASAIANIAIRIETRGLTIMHHFRVNERTLKRALATPQSIYLKRTSYYTRKRRQQRAPNDSLLFA
jgi:hypothetical protein